MRRERPLVTDIGRIVAARLAAARLRDLMDQAHGHNGRWDNYIDSAGGVISELSKRPLSERVPAAELSRKSVATLPRRRAA